jgi:hypothetical protein
MKCARRNEEATESVAATSPVININAGGQYFATTLNTLTHSFPDSMMSRMFTFDLDKIPRDEQGAYFMDTDPLLFGSLLHVLRRPNLIDAVPHGVTERAWMTELEHWGLRKKPFTSLDKRREQIQSQRNTVREKQKAFDSRVVHHILNCQSKCYNNESIVLGVGWDSERVLIPAGAVFIRRENNKENATDFDYTNDIELHNERGNNTEDFVDLGMYIWNNKRRLEKAIEKVLGSHSIVKITEYEKLNDYYYRGVNYDPFRTRTICVAISVYITKYDAEVGMRL